MFAVMITYDMIITVNKYQKAQNNTKTKQSSRTGPSSVRGVAAQVSDGYKRLTGRPERTSGTQNTQVLASMLINAI